MGITTLLSDLKWVWWLLRKFTFCAWMGLSPWLICSLLVNKNGNFASMECLVLPAMSWHAWRMLNAVTLLKNTWLHYCGHNDKCRGILLGSYFNRIISKDECTRLSGAWCWENVKVGVNTNNLCRRHIESYLGTIFSIAPPIGSLWLLPKLRWNHFNHIFKVSLDVVELLQFSKLLELFLH